MAETTTKPAHTACDDRYCARRDRSGNIRLNCGRGSMVAMKEHTVTDVQAWLETARSKRARAEYEAALRFLQNEKAS